MLTTIIAVGMFAIAPTAFADTSEKVKLCHWDKDAQIYKEISVPRVAAEKHTLKHDEDFERGSEWAPCGLNGFNVMWATYTNPSVGEGIFTAQGDGTWVEYDAYGNTYIFNEIVRDEWSAYICDLSRGVCLFIDTYVGAIRWWDETGNVLYEIDDAGASLLLP